MDDVSDSDDAQELLLGNEKKLVVVRSENYATSTISCWDSDEQLPGASTHAASFQIEKEDHTLGNALRYFINKK